MQKIRSKLLNSNMCVEAENDRRITGLACASPAPSWPFPLTTGVRPAEDKDKKHSHNPALQAAEEVIAALNG